LSALQATVTSP